MKKYEKPEVEVSVFTNEDIITASAVGLIVDSGKLSKGENIINF